MRSLLTRLIPRRRQLSLAGILVVVALLACLFNWMRPITRSEAIRIATAEFGGMPGSEAWSKSNPRAYRSAGSDGPIWVVNFDDPATGSSVAQISPDMEGHRLSAVLSYRRLYNADHHAATDPAHRVS